MGGRRKPLIMLEESGPQKREKDSCCQGNHTGHGNEETMKDFGGRSGAKARDRE